MRFYHVNLVEKQLLNFRNAPVAHNFRSSSLTIIWNNLGLSNYKRMKRNLARFRQFLTRFSTSDWFLAMLKISTGHDSRASVRNRVGNSKQH